VCCNAVNIADIVSDIDPMAEAVADAMSVGAIGVDEPDDKVSEVRASVADLLPDRVVPMALK
jgi:hypothetical protein